MTIEKDIQSSADFLDMQADVGVTKHIGGFEATNELLSLCHIEDAWEVLNVGCGIGVGSTYIAQKYGCRVMGVDVSEKGIKSGAQNSLIIGPVITEKDVELINRSLRLLRDDSFENLRLAGVD